MSAVGKRFAIVASRWNEFVVSRLIEGARDELTRYGASHVEVHVVPGSWEIPVAVRALLTRTEPDPLDAIVAVGCILQGATAHAQLLAADVSRALMNLQMEFGKPVSWGILTPQNERQALERAGMKMGNKGREAALAALEMANFDPKP